MNTTKKLLNQPQRVVVDYTPDQEGKDIKDDDVVRPKNHKTCETYGDERREWWQKSTIGMATYGNCPYCLKSGPTGLNCNVCKVKGKAPRYSVLVNNNKFLDAITISELMEQGHETARADRMMAQTDVEMTEQNNSLMHMRITVMYDHIKDEKERKKMINAKYMIFHCMCED